MPFGRFPRADALLGPEMKSTGEVMGVASDYPTAFGKAQAAAGAGLPASGTGFISVTDGDKAVINTPTGSGARADGYQIRRSAIARGIPCITTMSGASAAQRAIRAGRAGEGSVISLQELHGLPGTRLPGEDCDRVAEASASARSSGAGPEAERGA